MKAVLQLEKDSLALQVLFSGDKPAKQLVCGMKIGLCMHSFGDVSGGGFGSS